MRCQESYAIIQKKFKRMILSIFNPPIAMKCLGNKLIKLMIQYVGMAENKVKDNDCQL